MILAPPFGEAGTREVVLHVGGPGFGFSAAHSGLHDGVFEPLHGHRYTVRVSVHGRPDPVTGMLVDFRRVKEILNAHTGGLHNRTLIAVAAPGVAVDAGDDTVRIRGAGAEFALPRSWVALLPATNTSTEAIAACLLDGLAPDIRAAAPLADRLQVTVEESSTYAATVERVWT